MPRYMELLFVRGRYLYRAVLQTSNGQQLEVGTIQQRAQVWEAQAWDDPTPGHAGQSIDEAERYIERRVFAAIAAVTRRPSKRRL